MAETIELSWEACRGKARDVIFQLKRKFPLNKILRCWPVPNGGIPAALILSEVAHEFTSDPITIITANQPHEADFVFDDIVDSGKTRDQYTKMLQRPFYSLVDKLAEFDAIGGKWISFPWERMQKQEGPEDNILRILQYIGEDVERPGLKETPARVVKSYAELFAGYKKKPEDYVKVFEEEASDAMIVLTSEFYSACEHHISPFFGKAHLAYIPSCQTTHVNAEEGVRKKYRVLGASKLARIFDVFARRLQIQERIGAQFTQFLMQSELQPLGVGCIIEATHFCMCSRGVSKQHSKMKTSSIQGVFTKQEVRNEFLSLTRS